MDGLARSYASRDVVFLEYDVNSPHAVHRIDRFMAAWRLEKLPGEQSPDTPYTMTDSGQQISWGERDFKAEYRTMIESELPRPPLLLIDAVREQPSPSLILIKAQVTNISTVTLQTSLNGATLHVMLYEGNRALKTGRIVHASFQEYFQEPLRPGESRRWEFRFDRVPGVNLSQLDGVVMVDYQPDPILGRWDMMQAAVAHSGSLPAPPTPLPTSTATPVPTLTPVPSPTPLPTLTPTLDPERFKLYLPQLVRRYRVGGGR